MSLSSVFATIETDALNMVQAAEADATAWWKGFAPIVESDLTAFVKVVGPIVLNLVAAMATQAISGPAKFAAVSAALIAQAESQGVAATQTMANTVVQQAVASIGTAMGVKTGK